MMQPLRSWAQVELGTEARPFLVRWSTSYAPRAAANGPGLNYESYALRTAADGTRVYFTGDVIMGRQPDHPARQSPLHVTAPDTTSLRRLVDEDFDLLCHAHGLPHRNDPKALLARLLTATEGNARKGRP